MYELLFILIAWILSKLNLNHITKNLKLIILLNAIKMLLSMWNSNSDIAGFKIKKLLTPTFLIPFHYRKKNKGFKNNF